MLSRLNSLLRQSCDFGLYSMNRTDWTSYLWHQSSAPSQPPSSPGRRWPQGGSLSQRALSKLHQLGRGGGPASRNKPESPSRHPSAPWTRWRQKRHSRRGRQGTRSSRGGTAWENPPWWEEAGGRRETEGRGYQRWGRWIPPGPPWQAAPLGDWCAAWKDPAEAGLPGESSSTGRCLDNSESDWVWRRSSLDLWTKDRAVLQQSSERFMIFFFTVCKASMTSIINTVTDREMQRQVETLSYLLCQYLFQVLWREQSSVKQQVSTVLHALAGQDQQLMSRFPGQQSRHLPGPDRRKDSLFFPHFYQEKYLQYLLLKQK